MKKIYFLMLLIISIVSVSKSQVYIQDFDNKSDDWFQGKLNGLKYYIKNGSYFLDNTESNEKKMIGFPFALNILKDNYYIQLKLKLYNKNLTGFYIDNNIIIFNNYNLPIDSTFLFEAYIINNKIIISINNEVKNIFQLSKTTSENVNAGICIFEKAIISIDLLKIENIGSKFLPPNLFAELKFDDDNHNGIIEANENAKIYINLMNKGKGFAMELKIELLDSIKDDNLIFENNIQIPFLKNYESINVSIPIKALEDIKTNKHKLSINVKESFGYDMDPVFLVFNTLEKLKPNLQFEGFKIIESGLDDLTIQKDNKLQAGELVTLQLYIKNIGTTFTNKVKYEVLSNDPNVNVFNNKGFIDRILVGEQKDISVKITSNKRVDREKQLDVYIVLNDSSNNLIKTIPIPLFINQNPPDLKTITVNSNFESIKKDIARFEYNSSKFTTFQNDYIDIKNISKSKIEKKNSVGIIIGIENYRELAPAPYAENDAKIIKEYFEKTLGISNNIILTNDQVSGFIFDDLFNPNNGELSRVVKPEITEIYLYYSGHGIPDENSDQVFLVPNDIKIRRLKQQGISINDLIDKLNQLKPKKITLILDACFSGTSRQSLSYNLQNLTSEKGVKVRIDKSYQNTNNVFIWSSSNESETSYGYDQSETGLFTYFLCLGLQGFADKNRDKKVTFSELKDYVTSNVKEKSKNIYGKQQTPIFIGNDQDIIVEY